MKDTHLLTFVRKSLVFWAEVSLVALVLGELGRFYWLLELFSHFVPYYATILLLATAFSPNTWQKLLFGLNAMSLAVWMFTPQISPPAPKSQHFISYNLYINNPQVKTDLHWLAQQSADVVFLTEATPAMQIQQRLQDAYPYGCERTEDSPFGLVLLSKEPLKSCTVLQQGSLHHFPAIRTELGNGRIVYAIHPPPPITAYLANERDHVLQIIAGQVQQEQGEVLVMGDMNNTAFAPSFRQFLHTSRLTLQSPRIMPTWRPGYISIDHVLLRSAHSAAVSYAPWMGSDHRPVRVAWSLNP